jgi:hypothetical protein
VHDHVEDYAARKHPEFVVLDIGEDEGALVVHTDAEMHGVEIEISREGRDGHRSHKQVLERDAAGVPAYTAVFDSLAAGTYTLWSDGRVRMRQVGVLGGQVSELRWPRDAS